MNILIVSVEHCFLIRFMNKNSIFPYYGNLYTSILNPIHESVFFLIGFILRFI